MNGFVSTLTQVPLTRFLRPSLVLLGVALCAAGAAPVMAVPHASCGNGELKVYLAASDLAPRIEGFLNKRVAGAVVDTETKHAHVHDFRVTFYGGVMTVRCDYVIKERGWTKGPFGSKILLPWITDKGWLEIDVRTSVENGVFKVHTHHDNVRWSSKNWFVGEFREIFDRQVSGQVVQCVTESLTWAIGGTNLNLQGLFLAHGVPQMCAAYGLTPPQAQAWLTANLGRLKVTAGVDNGGIFATAPVNLGVFVRNTHRAPVMVAVRYKDLNGQWAMSDWVKVVPGQGAFLTNHGKRVMPADDTIFYFAEGKGHGWNWHGDHHFDHEGRDLHMRQQRLTMEEDGRYSFVVQ